MAYCPLFSLTYNNRKNKKFPLNLKYSSTRFLIINFADNILEKTLSYIEKLMKRKKYKGIISQNDCNLMCGFLEAMIGAFDENDKNSFDALTALSFSGFSEATYKLIIVYLLR